MTRMVSQILWEHCMGELGIDGNNYENDTFAVHSYDWVDEDNNEWHFWHKPSGLKVQWYKYPLRGFEANMEITDDQFLDVLRDCTNSMEDGKAVRFLHDIRRWWADRKTETQKKEVEWVYNKRERLWYPYSNGELLFKEKPTTQTETQNSNLTFETDTPQTEQGKCPFDDPIPCEWVNCPNSKTDCAWK